MKNYIKKSLENRFQFTSEFSLLKDSRTELDVVYLSIPIFSIEFDIYKTLSKTWFISIFIGYD